MVEKLKTNTIINKMNYTKRTNLTQKQIRLLGLFLGCLFIFFVESSVQLLKAQKNIELQSQVFFPGGTNDIWGYTDENGKEYALVGKQYGFAVVNISEPTAPEIVYEVSGGESLWRDVKTWKDYAYVVDDEASEGLLIVDMTGAPDTFSHTYWYGWPNCNVASSMEAHNIFIDENGFAYLMGATCSFYDPSGENGGNAQNAYGMLILDLNEDPLNPTLVGIYDNNPQVFNDGTYVHDIYVRNDTAYMGQIYDGLVVIADVSDKSDFEILGSVPTSGNFSHQVWLSDDGDYLFTNDEVNNGFIDAFDVSDFSDIQFLDKIQSSPGENVVPHNSFYIDGFLVTSYYKDGVVIHDVHEPDNMVEVANFDTAPELSGSGTDGCWGVYPYFPSGLIVASDMNNGLFVLEPNYVRAAYLEVNVVDQNGLPVPNALVEIEETGISTFTNVIGGALTGACESGTYTVSVNGGLQQVTGVELAAEGTTQIEITIERSDFNVQVKDLDGNPVAQPTVTLVSSFETITQFADESGNLNLSNLTHGQYDIYIGKWGYQSTLVESFVFDDNNAEKTFFIKKQYHDDFGVDLGWSTSGEVDFGDWQRAKPNGTFYQNVLMAPFGDLSFDLGDQCYITGLGGGNNAGASDVDNGTTVLRSPLIDVSDQTDPWLSYHRWFANAGGLANSGPPNDTLSIFLETETEDILIDAAFGSNNNNQENSSWVFNSIRLLDYIDIADQFRLKLTVGDQEESGHIVEAAFDGFSIVDSSTTSNETFNLSGLIKDADGNDLTAQVLITGSGVDKSFSNANGDFLFENVDEGSYQVTIAAWGYEPQQIENVIVNGNSQELDIVLQPNYTDDFQMDLGWSVTNEGEEGSATWELGVPEGTADNGNIYNPFTDVATDRGTTCYVTGLEKGENAAANDVDGGPVTLTSPVFDLNSYEDPWLSYHYWFTNGGGTSAANDDLTVSISNGNETVVIETINENKAEWIQQNIRVQDFLSPSEDMTILFSVTDNGDDHLTEAAVDYFAVFDSTSNSSLGVQELNLLNASIAPNPVEVFVTLSFEEFDFEQKHQLSILDLSGKLLLEQNIVAEQTRINVETLTTGMYLMAVRRGGELMYLEKLVKE